MSTNHEQESSTNQKNINKITSDREKMSRALGAAFLQHKVKELERNLDDLSFKRDSINTNQQKEQNKIKSKKKIITRREIEPIQQTSSNPVPIKIIDTSILIHALPLLKKWNRDNKFKIIIPLDVISELDFLKSSPPPIHGLVREATNWLDTQFKNFDQQIKDDKPCLRPQRTGDECRWDELIQHFISPPIKVASIPILSNELILNEEEDKKEENEIINIRCLLSNDLPQRYRSLFQCTLYYQTHAQLNQKVKLVIFISNNNNNIQKDLNQSNSLNKSNEIKNQQYEELKQIEEIIPMSHWADYFKLQVEKIYNFDLIQIHQLNRNQKKNKKLNNNQQQPTRTILKNQHSTSSYPIQSSSKPIIQRTILSRKFDPSQSTSTSTSN